MQLSVKIASAIACVALSASAIPREQFQQPSVEKLNSIPNLVLPDRYQNRTTYPLPAAVDNVSNKYMPPFAGWCIRGWSCANAAAVSNCFNYEMNFAYDQPSDGSRPQYPYLFTYEFLNSGNVSTGGDGWMFVDAFDIVKETGCPTSTSYGGFEWGYQTCGWMSGYDKYYEAMKNRISEYYQIDGRATSAVELIKQYLHDHADGSALGGLLVFQCASQWTSTRVPDISAHAGERMLSFFGKSEGGHGVVIGGYDDEVGYDYNGDGRLTNEGDDVKNWEKGSWKIVNNWGDGCYWAPYRLLAIAPREGGAGTNSGNPVMLCRIRKDYSPQVTFKVSITHDRREDIQILTGFAEGSTATTPRKTKDYAAAFNYAGGALPMAGKNQSETIEIGLDLTEFTQEFQGGGATFFLQVNSRGGSGTINSLSLMDYTGSSVNETACSESNQPIRSGATTTMSVAWPGSSTATAKSHLQPTGTTRFSVTYDRHGRSFRLSLPVANAQSARLSLRDINGRLVSSHALENLQARTVTLPGCMADGRALVPGMYIAVVELRDSEGVSRRLTGSVSVVY